METSIRQNPPVDQPVMVSYEGFECLAYVDSHGIWHDWYTDREIKNVASWLLLE